MSMDTLQGLLFFIALLAIWALPIIIAVARKHHQIAPITLITLLASWTIVGWFVALVWSVAATAQPATQEVQQ